MQVFKFKVIDNKTVEVSINAETKEEALEIIEGNDFEGIRNCYPSKVIDAHFEVVEDE